MGMMNEKYFQAIFILHKDLSLLNLDMPFHGMRICLIEIKGTHARLEIPMKIKQKKKNPSNSRYGINSNRTLTYTWQPKFKKKVYLVEICITISAQQGLHLLI